jgi:hypothetical protein
MTSSWQDVRCADIPEGALSVLADLRREPGIRVTIAGGRASVCWDSAPGSDATRHILVERLLPLAGVEIFVPRDGRWYRPGERLPAFELPIPEGSGGAPLAGVILPEPLAIPHAAIDAPRPVSLGLVRDARESFRPAAAVRCLLGQLAEWAERAPSAWIEALSAAWCNTAGEEAEVLVLGPSHSTATHHGGLNHIPAFDGGLRFWGRDVLIPLGYRSEPELTERALRDAVGAGRDQVVVFDHTGPEQIPRRAFRRLTRASIRLARAAAATGNPAGGGLS